MRFKKIVLSAIASFVLTLNSTFSDIGIYKKVHRDVWANGGVCRNAAALVWQHAREDGLEAKVLLFSIPRTKEGYTSHAVPVIREGGWWYAIESVPLGDKIFYSRHRRSKELRTDPNYYEHIQRGRVLDDYLGEVDSNTLNNWIFEYNGRNGKIL